MTTSKSRQAFYDAARQQIAILRKKPKLKRKQLIPLLTDLLAGTLLILEEREPGDGKVAKA
jgi:hypothetical protein